MVIYYIFHQRLVVFALSAACDGPVFRSTLNVYHAAMVELVDTRDLKSLDQKWLCDNESITLDTIESWGNEYLRTSGK